MADISDYDKFGYDYRNYWEKRSYENYSEKILLNRIFQEKRGNWFLDIGGSFGRLGSTYNDQYRKPIILDYSLKTLQKNKPAIQAKYPNIELIAANAYKMPFKKDVFDAALMVRVLHHIEKPTQYLKELNRVMSPNSYYIQEFANKTHIKAVLRALLKADFTIFNQEPLEHTLSKNPEGSKNSQKGIFLNYHPKYVRGVLEKTGFKIENKYGCSFLRIPLLKKFFNEDIMIFIEKIMQRTLSWTSISPSIFYETIIQKEKGKTVQNGEKLEEILACPSCKKDLIFKNEELATCKKCGKEYHKKDDIWDFRIK